MVDVGLLGRELWVHGGLSRADRVAEPHPSRLRHPAPDAERQRLGRLHAVAVLGEDVERRDRPRAGLGVAARDDAAADVAADLHLGLADPNAPADPGVLLVRIDSVDAEEHPEAPRVDRLVDAAGLSHRLQRAGREERHRRGATIASGARLDGLDEAQRPAYERRDRLGPRASTTRPSTSRRP